MKNILVAIESVNDASQLIDWAIQKAKEESADIILAQVTPATVDSVVWGICLKPNINEQYIQIQKDTSALNKWAQYIKDNNIAVHRTIVDGTSIMNLLTIIDNKKVNLIIMASDGKAWLKEKIKGSSWIDILKSCQVPLILLPNQNKIAA